MLDRETRRTHRLYDFTQAHRLVPDQAYGVLGKVSSADKLYRGTESVKPDAKHNRASNSPVPVDGAESLLSREYQRQIARHPGPAEAVNREVAGQC